MIRAAKLLTCCFYLVLLFAGCVTSVDEALPYAQLPEITLATEVKLVASPSHPTAYLPINPIPAGVRVQVIGADKNAAWLLVLHDNVLGWVPTFFSRDNVGTLNTAFTFEPLSDQCTTYLDATFAPEEVWNSTVDGVAIALGAIYRPVAQTQVDSATLAIEIDGAGQAVEADYVHTLLTPSSSLILFAFAVNDLQKGSQVNFTLADAGGEPFFFQAAFFSDSCAKAGRFTSQLPVGKHRVILAQPIATPQAQAYATEPSPTENVTVIRQSDARTPTPTLTPTPFPTLDMEVYGSAIAISETTASSVYMTNSFPINKATDGDTRSFWSSGINDDIGAWLELRLATPMTITGIRIYSPGADGTRGQPRQLTLLFADNPHQTMVIDDTPGWHYQALTPVKTESVRLVVESVNDTGMVSNTRLYEIQILGEPQAPILIETDNPSVFIRLRSGAATTDAQANGRLKVSFLRHDEQPLVPSTATIFSLEEDVAGDLIRTDAVRQELSPDNDGFYWADLSPQQYLFIWPFPHSVDEPVVPSWYSDADYEGADKANYRGIIFPVEVGKTTEIEVRFSRLVVGVLDKAGKAVRGDNYPSWAVMVCADNLGEVTDETLRCAKRVIDRRGAAAFQLAPGAYHLRVLTDADCYWEFPVRIGLREAKDEIVTINSAQPDGCLDGGQ
jgi:hypothetical protein